MDSEKSLLLLIIGQFQAWFQALLINLITARERFLSVGNISPIPLSESKGWPTTPDVANNMEKRHADHQVILFAAEKKRGIF
jgi:hypothetical protein